MSGLSNYNDPAVRQAVRQYGASLSQVLPQAAQTAQTSAATQTASPTATAPQVATYMPYRQMRSPEEIIAQAMQAPAPVPVQGGQFTPILMPPAASAQSSLAASLGIPIPATPTQAQQIIRPIFGAGPSI